MENTILDHPEISIENDIERIFQAQRKNAQSVKDTTPRERIAKLKKLKKYIVDNRSLIHEAVYKDFRKASAEADIGETLNILSSITHASKHLSRWMKPKRVPTPLNLIGSSSKILLEPKGVVLIISPWNYPFNLAIDPLVYAIAAGNTAILKPSEMTPHTSAFIKKMITDLYPENEIAVFEGDAKVATALLQKPFDHIFFTGSPQLGKVIMRAAAENLTSVTLELGGKSPSIVDETANLKDAAYKIMYGKFLNCGQTCIAPDYVLAHESIKDKLVDEMKTVIKQFYGENPQNSPDFPRIVNARHFQRVKGLLDNALEQGAEVKEGGITDGNENYVSPTILSNINDDMEVMHEEIFGPILPVLGVKNMKQATDYIATKPKPLALYMFGKSKENRKFVLDNTTAGGTSINETLMHIGNPDLPFGGVNNSGIGKTHGYHGFLSFSNERAVLTRWGLSAIIKMLYPPYTDKVKSMIQRFIKMA